MRKFFNNRWFLFVLRLALGGVFLYAGATKVSNPQAFADSIATFKMLPPQLLNIVALGLPPFEILLGLMLISGWKARAASLALAAGECMFRKKTIVMIRDFRKRHLISWRTGTEVDPENRTSG